MAGSLSQVGVYPLFLLPISPFSISFFCIFRAFFIKVFGFVPAPFGMPALFLRFYFLFCFPEMVLHLDPLLPS